MPKPDEGPAVAKPNVVSRRNALSIAATSLAVGGVGGFGIAQVTEADIIPGPKLWITKEDQGAASQAFDYEIALNPRSAGVYWSVETTEPKIALTFDDGPDPQFTPGLLDVLDSYDVKATFLMMGHNIEAHTDLAKEVLSRGHEVGNHTFEHLDLAFETKESAEDQIQRGHDILVTTLGVEAPRWFRPPRGDLSGRAVMKAAALNYDILLWTIIGRHPDGIEAGLFTKYMLHNTQAGNIITLHDGLGRGTFNPGEDFTLDLIAQRTEEIKRLPEVLEGWLDAGLKPGTASELIGPRQ